jgi:hypothetical protein
MEFWRNTTGQGDGQKYAQPSVWDNLFLIFGTYKIIRILSPSLRNVPLTGLEWSFMLWNRSYVAQPLNQQP